MTQWPEYSKQNGESPLSGLLQFGDPTAGDASVADYTLMHEETRAGTLTIASDDPTVLPGQTFLGIVVANVLHRVNESGNRTVLFEQNEIGRLGEALDAITRRGNPVDLFAFYEYDVVDQNGGWLL